MCASAPLRLMLCAVRVEVEAGESSAHGRIRLAAVRHELHDERFCRLKAVRCERDSRAGQSGD